MKEADGGSSGPEVPGPPGDAGAVTPSGGETGPAGPEAGDTPASAADGRLAGPRPPEEAITVAGDDLLPDDEDPWSDAGDPADEYDGDDGDDYDGDVAAFLAREERLPEPRTGPEAAAAAWDSPRPVGEDPWPDADDPAAGYDASVAAFLAGEERLPEPRTGPEAAADAWDDSPGDDEEDPAAEYDADSSPLTPEAPGASAAAAPEREDGTATAPEPSPAGVTADAGSAADAGEQPAEAPQAGQADAPTGQRAQPDAGRAGPDAASDAYLKELKAEYEAVKGIRAEYEAALKDVKEQKAEYETGLKDLTAEREAVKEQRPEYAATTKELKAEREARLKLEADVQALKDSRQTATDAADGIGGDADRPRPKDRKLSEGQRDAREAEHKDDRPGLWSNAKYQLYGPIGTLITTAAISEVILKSPSGAVIAFITGIPTLIAAFVPTMREGWKRKRDDSKAKP